MILSKLARSVSPYLAGEQPQDKRYVKLNTNENPYPPSDAVKRAIREFDADTLRLYPDPDSTELRRAIADRYGVGMDSVYVGNGSDEVLALSFPTFFDEGETIVFPDITYSFYPVYCGFYRINYETKPLREDFTVGVEDYTHSDRGIVIANPNAPTGIALSVEDIERIVSTTDKVVIVDEAYADFANTDVLGLVNRYDNLLVVRTLSKSFSMAGMRLGYAIGAPALIDGLNRIKNCFNSYPVDKVCEAAAIEAIRDREYHERITREVVRVRDVTKARLRELGYTVTDSEANFLFVGDGDGESLYRYLKDRGILVRYFSKPRINGFVRITVGTEKDMDALVQAMGEYKAK